ncbi:hypothetical protein GIB67_013136 [Kingdonia uniflora]|uniref:Uncharacterized protein n=1 Tax=Kingdonia uniflora TaxID=39325 RepID=A0A7J7LPL8_9MAGN|nr:hypothetical protein GIB67_013136 [Kingdonia uniflora]
MSTSYLTEHTILSARNDDVSFTNARALEMMSGEELSILLQINYQKKTLMIGQLLIGIQSSL